MHLRGSQICRAKPSARSSALLARFPLPPANRHSISPSDEEARKKFPDCKARSPVPPGARSPACGRRSKRRHRDAHDVCYVIADAVALTGDFIFVRSIGRPDLAGKTAEWTVDLWNSLHAVKRAYADDQSVEDLEIGRNRCALS